MYTPTRNEIQHLYTPLNFVRKKTAMLLHNFISFALSDVSKEENLFIANQAEQLLPFVSLQINLKRPPA